MKIDPRSLGERFFGEKPKGQSAAELMGKGRSTLRRGATGPSAVRIPIWQFKFEPKSTGGRLERAYLASLAALDAFEDTATETRKSGKFTDAGALHEIGNHALKQAMPSLHRNREIVRRAKADVTELRTKVRLPDPDKGDAVGYLRRLEIRGHLAGMPDEKRKQFISQNRERLDPEWVRAIVEMPPIMSGLMETDHAWFMDRELRNLHGDAVDEVKALEEAWDVANRVTELARGEICHELGVLPGAPPSANAHLPRPRDLNRAFEPAPGTALYQSQFDELADVFECTHDAPWLKRVIENGQEVVRVFKNQSWPVASEDDAEHGIFYKDYDHYQRRAA